MKVEVINVLPKTRDRWWQRLLRLAFVALLLIAGGCEDDDETDENGDPLPKLAEYRVTLGETDEVGRGAEEITLVPQSPSKQVRLRVDCTGDNIPPGCSTHNPNWTASAFQSLRRVDVSIANRSASDTMATLFFNDFASLPEEDNESLGETGGNIIYINPTRVPDKMKLTGKRTLYVKVSRRVFDAGITPENYRNPPEPPAVPSLAISPPAITIASPATAGSVRVIYKGASTDLSSAIVSGGNANQFNVSVGPRPPLDKTVSFIVTVTYTGPTAGGYYATTTLVVTTANGAVARANVIARN